MSRPTATLIKRHPQREPRGELVFGLAALYQLSTPITYTDSRTGEECATRYVYVSTSETARRPETFAFPADICGKILDWCELVGSETWVEDHVVVLSAMGFDLIGSELPSRALS